MLRQCDGVAKAVRSAGRDAAAARWRRGVWGTLCAAEAEWRRFARRCACRCDRRCIGGVLCAAEQLLLRGNMLRFACGVACVLWGGEDRNWCGVLLPRVHVKEHPTPHLPLWTARIPNSSPSHRQKAASESKLVVESSANSAFEEESESKIVNKSVMMDCELAIGIAVRADCGPGAEGGTLAPHQLLRCCGCFAARSLHLRCRRARIPARGPRAGSRARGCRSWSRPGPGSRRSASPSHAATTTSARTVGRRPVRGWWHGHPHSRVECDRGWRG